MRPIFFHARAPFGIFWAVRSIFPNWWCQLTWGPFPFCKKKSFQGPYDFLKIKTLARQNELLKIYLIGSNVSNFNNRKKLLNPVTKENGFMFLNLWLKMSSLETKQKLIYGAHLGISKHTSCQNAMIFRAVLLKCGINF